MLRRQGVAPRFVPPVSIVLAARPGSYVEGLISFREGRVAAWCASFAGALERAARLSVELAKDVASLQEQWHERAGRPRRDSAAAHIIPVLPAPWDQQYAADDLFALLERYEQAISSGTG